MTLTVKQIQVAIEKIETPREIKFFYRIRINKSQYNLIVRRLRRKIDKQKYLVKAKQCLLSLISSLFSYLYFSKHKYTHKRMSR